MKVLKGIILASAVLILCSCSKPSYEERTGTFKLPPELQDCKIFKLQSSKGSSITMVRCPNSETSTESSCGKGCSTSVIID